MAQRNQGRIDRFAQMSKQEELIAKKRQEILEKQRTAQLAKAVAAAQELAAKLKSDGSGPIESVDEAIVAEEVVVEKEDEEDIKETSASAKTKLSDCDSPKSLNSFTGKTGKITFGLKRTQLPQPIAEQPPPKVVNTFCNDGSFLENFKKILEKHEQPKPPIVTTLSSTEAADLDGAGTAEMGGNEAAITVPVNENELPGVVPAPTPALHQQTPNLQQHHLPPQPIPPPPPSVPAPGPPPFTFNPGLMPQGPPQMQLPAAFFHGAMPMQIHPAVAPPPPPPPPQLPLTLANLTPIYMLPPDPMQLNALQAQKEYDMNAMQKPLQVPVSVAQVQEAVQQQQLLAAEQAKSTPPPPPTQPPPPEPTPAIEQQQQTNEQVFSETFHNDNELNCIKLPTTIENLIALVAEYGEEYEDKIRSHRSDLHPSMWFLYDKNCEQYGNYRRQFHERLQQQQRTLNVTQQQEEISKEQQQQQPRLEQQRQFPSTSAAEKYDPESVISDDMDSDDEYMRGMMDRNRDNIKRRIESRNELSEEERMEREEAEREEEARQRRKRERKSRWGEKILEQDLPTTSVGSSFGNQNKPSLSGITRNDPALLQYARLNYGSTQLSEEDWKKCEEHYKVNLLYQDMIRKRQEIDRLARSGKFKYDYDSDEDVEGGTWEHKLRTAEMEATRAWASALTKQSEGKHHIGDFLPPEELKKFMEQYEAKKNNRQPDLSDYKEYKLKEDNIGFQMLQKLGWKEGQGLGTDGAGIVDPVNKAPQRDGNQGLGVASVAEPEDCDNEYDAYRKRMMLAYRFRPNPLNNPRRAYY